VRAFREKLLLVWTSDLLTRCGAVPQELRHSSRQHSLWLVVKARNGRVIWVATREADRVRPRAGGATAHTARLTSRALCNCARSIHAARDNGTRDATIQVQGR